MGNSKKPKNSFLARRRGARISNEKNVVPDNVREINLPNDEKEVVAMMEATINGTRVGVAHQYADNSYDIVLDKDADPELVAILRGTLADGGATAEDFNIKEG